MKILKTHLLLGMMLVTIVLSGCITMASHLFTLRSQLCEFDDYFKVSLDQGVNVKLNQPVLLEREVFLMVGASPTSRVITADGMTASYVFEQLQTATESSKSSKSEAFELKFLFTPSDKGYLLSEIQSSDIPAELFESALTLVENSNEIALQACDIPINPLSRSVEIEMDRDMLELLPARQLVVSLLGPSSESTNHNDDLIYEFRLKSESTDLPVARIDAEYGQNDELPIAIDVSFTRYQASIDVPTGTMRVKLHF
jgi:hypothetical protein